MGTRANIKFYLYSALKEAGNKPIYKRSTVNRKKAELYTGFTSLIRDWNDENQASKTNAVINKELSKKKGAVYSYIDELEKENKPVTAAMLKDLLTGKSKVKIYLLEYLNAYIKEIGIRAQIKQISINKYKQSLESLKKYIPAKYSLPDITMDKVTYD